MSFQESVRCLNFLNFVPILIILTTLPFTILISLALYIVAYPVSYFHPSYGQFLSCNDVVLDEDFENSIPQTSLVISLTLQGDLSLDELRTIFTKNVLQARSQVCPDKLRYPKLQQYLTSLLFHRIWKNDPNFLVENHVVEEIWDGSDLGSIHQENLNKMYQKYRSPWELILIRNVNIGDNFEGMKNSILVLRLHHVMADAKSLLKLLVKCLGQQKLTTASPQYIQEIRMDYFRFEHPWKLRGCFQKSRIESDEVIVAFSPKLSLAILKQVAKQNNVKTSAVVMSIIAGAIRNTVGKDWDKEVAIAYPSPKPNHPECLTNHLYMTFLRLPTDQLCALERLQECNEEFMNMKKEQRGRYLDVVALFAGVLIYPINRLVFKMDVPTGITNNAGEEKGFFVGNAKCVDYRMSVGTMRGAVGVVFCTVSYKDGMRIAVIANKSVFSKKTAENLASCIEFELQILLKTSN